MVGGDSMGHGLYPSRVRFFNFLLAKLSREFKLRQPNIDISRNSNGHGHAVSPTRIVYAEVTLT